MYRKIIFTILISTVLLISGCSNQEEKVEKPSYESGNITNDNTYIINKLIEEIDKELNQMFSLKIIKYHNEIKKENIFYKISTDTGNNMLYVYDLENNYEFYQKEYITYFKEITNEEWYYEYINQQISFLAKNYIPTISLPYDTVSYDGREIFNTIICNVLNVNNLKYYVNEETGQLVGIEETLENDEKNIWLIKIEYNQQIEDPNINNKTNGFFESFIKEHKKDE